MVGEFAPDAVVNAAAMTNVDALRARPGTSVRGERPRRAPPRGGRRHARGAHVVHISHRLRVRRRGHHARTTSGPRSRPLSEYGRSKLGGEVELAAHASSWAIVRTSWVFGKRGSDLISWAFGAYDRGELDGVLADSGEHPHLRARPRRAARAVRGASAARACTTSPADPRRARATSSSPPRCGSAASTPTTWRRSPTIPDRPARRPPVQRARQPRPAPRPSPRPAPLARRPRRVREGLVVTVTTGTCVSCGGYTPFVDAGWWSAR